MACWRGFSCNDHIHLSKRCPRPCEFISTGEKNAALPNHVTHESWDSSGITRGRHGIPRKTRDVGVAAPARRWMDVACRPAGNGCPIDCTTAAAFFPACITGSRCDLVSGLRGPPSVTAVAEELIMGHVFRSAPSHTHTLPDTGNQNTLWPFYS